MEFRFRAIESLPGLAWCARVTRGSPAVDLMHGPGVETGDGVFVGGAWDGEFADGRPDASCALMGSAGRIDRGMTVFAAPCHTLERLHVLRGDDSLWVSNSLPFILEAGRTPLDPDYPFSGPTSGRSSAALAPAGRESRRGIRDRPSASITAGTSKSTPS